MALGAVDRQAVASTPQKLAGSDERGGFANGGGFAAAERRGGRVCLGGPPFARGHSKALWTVCVNAWLAIGERAGLAAQLIEIAGQEWQFTTSLIFHKGIFQKFPSRYCIHVQQEILLKRSC